MNSSTSRRQGRFGRRILMFLVVVFGVALSFALGNAAWSYFGPAGKGTAQVSVAKLNAPTNVSATFPNHSQRTVEVSWTAPVEPDGIVVSGYYVTRNLGATSSPACGTSPSVLTTSLSCQDTDVASNSYTYSVTAVFRTWSSGATSTNVTVPAPVLSSLDLDVITTNPVAGTNTSVGIVAHDQYGAVFSAYNGPECLNFTGAGVAPDGRAPNYTNAGLCSGGDVVEFVDGVGTANLTLYDAQSFVLQVADVTSTVTGSAPLSVAPGKLESLSVAPETATPVAGVPFTTALTALDGYGNVDSGYSGAECVAFSGPLASPNGTTPDYPAAGACATGSSVDFVKGQSSGLNAASITLFDATGGVLSAVDVPSGAGGFAGLTVQPASPKTFALGTNADQVAGTAFPVSLTTLDSYGNTDTDYSGSECIAFSGASNAPDGTGPSYGMAGSCASGTQVTFENGVADGANVVPITLFDAQTLSLVATDPLTGATGLVNLTVTSAGLDSFALAPSNPSPVAGDPISLGLTALDQYQNVDTNYAGSECIAFSGAANAPDGTGPSYPAAGSCASGGSEVSFSAGLATGGAAPSITFYDAEPLDLIATDVPSQHFGSTGIDVTPGTLQSFAVIPDSHTQVAGTSFTLRLTALDQYQNVDTNFTGAQCVTFSGPDPAPNGAVPDYPAQGTCASGATAVTFTSGYVDGANTLSLNLFDAESTDLTATLATGTQTGSTPLTVAPSPAIAGIGISGVTQSPNPAMVCTGGVGSISCTSSGESASSGNVLTASVQLEDQYGNATVNASAEPVLIDFQTTGQGNVVPGGTGALSISSGQSTSTGTFSLTRDIGTGQSVVMTATLENTAPAQTLTITLSS